MDEGASGSRLAEKRGENMNGKDIIIEWLKEKGFDGLYLPDSECGCCVDDLIPCASDPCFCEPGKKHINESGDWEIGI